MSKANVEVSNIAVRYGSNVVLHDINLAIEPGEFFALLGPSGSGKSTLLRLIAGFIQAHSGRVLIAGADVSGVPPWERNVGMVFQNYALWPHMTVRENVAFGLEERRLASSVVAEKVRAALGLVNLVEYAERRPSQLSGGQQQRVALARTIAVEPKVLLLDEPLSNLDAKLRIRMREELRALQRKLGITTIFVTHDQEEAMTTADRIAVMDQGVIQQVGTAMQIFDDPANRFVANFVGSINLLAGRVEPAPGGATFHSALLGHLHLPQRAARVGEAEIVIRPHSIVLARAPGGAGYSWLVGSVADREFLGAFIRYTVKVGEQHLVAEEPHRIGRESHRPGDAVHVGIDPAQVRLLAAG
jgi:iron(III) transport system ATP-binding protein